jgi:hypothetical protein
MIIYRYIAMFKIAIRTLLFTIIYQNITKSDEHGVDSLHQQISKDASHISIYLESQVSMLLVQYIS